MRLSLFLLPFFSALCLAARRPSRSSPLAELDAFFEGTTVTDVLTGTSKESPEEVKEIWENKARKHPGTFATVLVRTLSKLPKEVKSEPNAMFPYSEDREEIYLPKDHSLLGMVEREVCPIKLNDPSIDRTLKEALGFMRLLEEPIQSVKVELQKSVTYFQADVLKAAHQLSAASTGPSWWSIIEKITGRRRFRDMSNKQRFSFLLKLKQMAEIIGGYKDYPVLEVDWVGRNEDVKIWLEHLANQVFEDLMKRLDNELEFYPENWLQTLKLMVLFRTELKKINDAAEDHVSRRTDKHFLLLISLIQSITPSLILHDDCAISVLKRKDMALNTLLWKSSESIKRGKVSAEEVYDDDMYTF